MKIFNEIADVDVPAFEDGRLYIYVLENEPQHNIKIGRSSNMQQRLKALSGSNSGGNHITRIAVSDATWLYTLERIAHWHFHEYRIDGTEWFSGVLFEEITGYIDSLFQHKNYETCNRVREGFVKAQDRYVVPEEKAAS